MLPIGPLPMKQMKMEFNEYEEYKHQRKGEGGVSTIMYYGNLQIIRLSR